MVHRNHAFRRWGVCLPHVVGDEGAVETGGRLGELGGRQLEKTGGGLDEPGRNVAAAAGAAHVVEGLGDGVCPHPGLRGRRMLDVRFGTGCRGRPNASSGYRRFLRSLKIPPPGERSLNDCSLSPNCHLTVA